MPPAAPSAVARTLRPRRHILVVIAVTFVALLVSAGLRATPGVLMVPLQLYFGWDRATIPFAASLAPSPRH